MTIPGWPGGLGLHIHQTLDSTNEEARRLARAGETGPLWIMAREQSAGRGRRGRVWTSLPGNLFASLLIEAPPHHAPQLGFAAGLATLDALDPFVPASSRLTLKWPNDVLLDGRKAAGILLESLVGNTAAIGIGINLAHHPADTEFPAISLGSVAGAAPSPEAVLARLAASMTAWYEHWRRAGFLGLRPAWLQRAEGLERPIRARLAETEMTGMFESLDDDGALILRGPDGMRHRIAGGDVFFRT